MKTLETDDFKVNVYKEDVIGSVNHVESGTTASYEWKDAQEGINGWYAEVTDENGGLSRTNVYYVNVQTDTEKPVLTVPEKTVLKEGDTFDEMGGVTAKDNVDGDITHKIIVTGKVNTSVAGTYELVYEVTDAAGNKAQVTREIIVETKSATDLNSQDTNKSEGSNNHVSTTPNADIKSQSSVKTSDKSNIKTPLLFTVFSLVIGGVFVTGIKRRK